MTRSAFLCDAVRTPIGRYGGALATVRTDDLAAVPIRALVARNPRLDVQAIDDVYLGCANQAGEDNRNVARMASLLAGLPDTTPGVTLNRLCASGADAVGTAARAIVAGDIELAIAGGVESMTRSPFVLGKTERPFDREARLQDTTIGWRFVNPALKSAYGVDPLTDTAENVADAFGLTREAQDAFALRSQQRTGAARDDGFFAEEIVSVTVPVARGEDIVVSLDEHPRPDTTAAGLARLKPIVRPNGTVTAGNASGVNDGAAAMLVASEAAVARFGLTPKARIVAMATGGVAPRVMGMGPVPATTRLLERLRLSMSDFDVIEINEAFASQVIASLTQLGVDPFADHVNRRGGAIALGHPLGMSGARLCMTAAHALQADGGRRALVTMCIGVGQGLSIALERV